MNYTHEKEYNAIVASLNSKFLLPDTDYAKQTHQMTIVTQLIETDKCDILMELLRNKVCTYTTDIMYTAISYRKFDLLDKLIEAGAPLCKITIFSLIPWSLYLTADSAPAYTNEQIHEFMAKYPQFNVTSVILTLDLNCYSRQYSFNALKQMLSDKTLFDISTYDGKTSFHPNAMFSYDEIEELCALNDKIQFNARYVIHNTNLTYDQKVQLINGKKVYENYDALCASFIYHIKDKNHDHNVVQLYISAVGNNINELFGDDCFRVKKYTLLEYISNKVKCPKCITLMKKNGAVYSSIISKITDYAATLWY